MIVTFKDEFAKIIEEQARPTLAQTVELLKSECDGQQVVLFGAGEMASVVYKMYSQAGLRISCVCDNYKSGIHHGTGLPIISSSELKEKHKRSPIMIATWRFEREIADGLRQWGFSEKQIYHLPALKRISTEDFLHAYFEGYSWVYDMLEDERSKEIVSARARLYIKGQPLAPNSHCDMYYEEGYISLNQKEVFVDGGAFTGGSAEEFAAKAGAYSHIYSFEPDAFSCEQARRRLCNYPNVDVIQKGLFSEESELTFYRNTTKPDGSSFMYGAISDVPQSIQVTSIDSFFAGRLDGELPTFIKLDVEGAEKAALLGARDVIGRVKPKLAVCVYHKPQDIYELPQTISLIRGDYRFALRQHEYCCNETILYAV